MTAEQFSYSSIRTQYEQNLSSQYDLNEANAIFFLLLESITGISKTTYYTQEHQLIDSNKCKELRNALARLQNNEPVQYIIGSANFFDLKIGVNRNVLIPRPETEELVEWILESENLDVALKILDVGTGSGCIALALKNHHQNWDLTAIDISKAAIETAERNAHDLKLEVNFHEMDMTQKEEFVNLPSQDVFVSNPPYVVQGEQAEMAKHVINFEPHIALFVPTQDPIKFYIAILKLAQLKLKSGGRIYVEINPKYVDALVDTLRYEKFSNVEIKKDLSGKLRFIRATI